MNYIPRALEDRLRKYEKTYKALLVTGPRQVGKSTLLKKTFPHRKYVSCLICFGISVLYIFCYTPLNSLMLNNILRKL